MSAIFDTLQELIQDFVKDEEVKREARALVGVMHSYAHKNNDDANRDQASRIAAGRLSRAMQNAKTKQLEQ